MLGSAPLMQVSQFRIFEFVRETVHGTLGSMMYDPNVFTPNLQQLLSGVPSNVPIRVVQVTVEAARRLEEQDR